MGGLGQGRGAAGRGSPTEQVRAAVVSSLLRAPVVAASVGEAVEPHWTIGNRFRGLARVKEGWGRVLRGEFEAATMVGRQLLVLGR